jgi:peptidyl-prolyl cis-trans isomerase A (cyclophilin A)
MVPSLVVAVVAAAALTAAAVVPVVADETPLDPYSLTEEAPATFKVKFETSKGNFIVEVIREWAPDSADRFYSLAKTGAYDDGRFHEVTDLSVTFGTYGSPTLSAALFQAGLTTDPKKAGCERGSVSSILPTEVTVFLVDVPGNCLATPFGKVLEGMDVVEALYNGYGWRPKTEKVFEHGNEYLDKKFPKLDRLLKSTVIFEDQGAVDRSGREDSSGSYRVYSGPKRPDDEVATLLLPDDGWLIVRNDDSSPTGSVRVSAESYRKVEVLPGQVDISWGKTAGRTAELFVGVCAHEVVPLEAGHVYLLGANPRYFGGSVTPTTSLWIENTGTKKIIAGRKPTKFLEPGQINPPPDFRWLLDHASTDPSDRRFRVWYEDCESLTGVSYKDPEVLNRREMIIRLGNKWMVSDAKQSIHLRYELESIAGANEGVPGAGCSQDTKANERESCADYRNRDCCDVVLESLRSFVKRVKAKVQKGRLNHEAADDLISTATLVLALFERETEFDSSPQTTLTE